MNEPLTIKDRFKLSRFTVGEKAVNIPVTLNHRRIFILPTQRGLGFVVLIAILLLLAFVYNNNLAYILVFMLAGIFFVSILHSYKSMAGIIVAKGKNSPVFAGDKAGLNIVIKNPATIKRINLHVSTTQTEIRQVDLMPESTDRITLFSDTDKRGWLELGTVTLTSFFPLGLFRAWSPINLRSRVLVYPKPVEKTLPFPETFMSSHPRGRTTSGSDDFSDFRNYQAGDPIRQIHWKAYAKEQGLYSKQYSGEKSTEIWLIFEQTPGKDLEERLSQMCRWVNDAEKAGVNYGFELPGIRLAPGRGAGHSKKCLESLALF